MNAEGVPGLKHTKGLYDVEHGKHHAKSRTMAIREAVHSAGDALDGAVLCQHQTGVGAVSYTHLTLPTTCSV